MNFVANFISFPAAQKLWKLVKIWKSYREFKGGNFFETQCSSRVSSILQAFICKNAAIRIRQFHEEAQNAP